MSPTMHTATDIDTLPDRSSEDHRPSQRGPSNAVPSSSSLHSNDLSCNCLSRPGGSNDKVLQIYVNSESVGVQPEGRIFLQRQRGSLLDKECHPSEIIHDLISSSLQPLSVNAQNAKDIAAQATEFMSCFDDHCSWSVEFDAAASHAAEILELIPESRPQIPAVYFIMFRFPYIRYEWHVLTPYMSLNHLNAGDELPMEFMWKAWPRNGSASGTVAHGHCRDIIRLNKAGHPIIVMRTFSFVQISDPDIMYPIPYEKYRTPSGPRHDSSSFILPLTLMKWSRSYTGVSVAVLLQLMSLYGLVDIVTTSAIQFLLLIGISLMPEEPRGLMHV